MGNKRNTKRLSGIDKFLHDQIVQDLYKKDSKILTKLLQRFEEISQSSDNKEILAEQVLPFMKPRNKTRIEPSNARTVIKKTIQTKMRNIRKVSSQKGTCYTSSFNISEIFEYCNLLKINPAEVFMNIDIQPFLLPLKYCEAEEIKVWLNQAKTKPPTDGVIRIPFCSAPIIDVDLDIYFSAQRANALDKEIAHSISKAAREEKEPIEKLTCDNNPPIISDDDINEVRMQAFLTVKAISSSGSIKTTTIDLCDRHKNSEGPDKVSNHLVFAQKCFYAMCEKRYDEEQKYIENLAHFSAENAIAQYCSETFSSSIKTYLNDALKKLEAEESGRNKDMSSEYPKSELKKIIEKFYGFKKER